MPVFTPCLASFETSLATVVTSADRGLVAMLPRAEFVGQVAEAYEHLYDLIFLRTHPAADLLVPDPSLPRKDKAWQLHRLLLEAVEELKPEPGAPPSGREARRYQLLTRRYVDGLDPQRVADELGISRRHYYREHDEAMAAIATVLWERQAPPLGPPVDEATLLNPPLNGGRQEGDDRLGLLRLEAARLAQADRYTDLAAVLAGAVSLLQERLERQALRLDLTLPEALPGVAVDRNLLRQMLLMALGYLVERAEQATIRLTAQAQAAHVAVHLSVDPADALCDGPSCGADERLAMLGELAGLAQVRFEPLWEGSALSGFGLQLPGLVQRLVLVVDDNEDVLELFERYLTAHHYSVALARSAAQGLALARQLQPYAITLDLMMPEQDGWDVLQTLLNQPETQQIPVIVCSVLRARDLALYLGATAFLAKPVTEEALVAALEAIGRQTSDVKRQT